MAIAIERAAVAQVARALEADVLPLAEAVTRRLGADSWMLTFDARDRLRAVVVLGTPAVPAVDAPPPRRPPRDALERPFALPDGGVLMRLVGGSTATGRQLVDLALRFDDPDVRGEAVRVAVDAAMRDRDLERQLLAAIGGADDAALAAAVAGIAGDASAGLVALVAERARGRPLGRRAVAVLERLAPR